MSNLYDFSATKLSGETLNFAEYQNKVVLIVNTASQCGFTPQYEGLEKLYQDYKDSGLVVVGFPCNQFGKQEQGNSEEIESFCQLNYGVSFPMMDKIEVNGEHPHPLYNWLKSQKGGVLGKGIKWNFTKFLIGRDGQVVARYAPTKKPVDLAKDIEKLLT